MARLIKRYGSRKLYDTQESRYVSLEDISTWVRNGEDIEVQDNATGEDVTVQTLTQVISEEGRKGASFLPSDLLHDLIRVGNNAVTDRVRKFQDGFEGFVKKSFDRIVPVSTVRSEMDSLRQRLDELEVALTAAQKQEEASKELIVREETAPAKVDEKPAEEKPKRAPRARTTKSSTSKTGTRKTTAAKSTTAKPKSTTTKRTTRRSTAKKTESAAQTDSTKTQEEVASEA
jgi:polyhydroxyalkanoate synthesis repressor PhaR